MKGLDHPTGRGKLGDFGFWGAISRKALSALLGKISTGIMVICKMVKRNGHNPEGWGRAHTALKAFSHFILQRTPLFSGENQGREKRCDPSGSYRQEVPELGLELSSPELMLASASYFFIPRFPSMER